MTAPEVSRYRGWCVDIYPTRTDLPILPRLTLSTLATRGADAVTEAKHAIDRILSRRRVGHDDCPNIAKISGSERSSDAGQKRQATSVLGRVVTNRLRSRRKVAAIPGFCVDDGLCHSAKPLMALSGLFERARRMSAFLKGHEGGSVELDRVQP
jgi:hypothetical protein